MPAWSPIGVAKILIADDHRGNRDALAKDILKGTALAATDLLTATELSPLDSTGPGVFWTVVAMALAALVAGCSVVAGVVEREDADEAGPDGPRPSGAGWQRTTRTRRPSVSSIWRRGALSVSR